MRFAALSGLLLSVLAGVAPAQPLLYSRVATAGETVAPDAFANPLPGNPTFSILYAPLLNDNNQVVFYANFGTAPFSEGLFFWNGTNIRAMLRKDDLITTQPINGTVRFVEPGSLALNQTHAVFVARMDTDPGMVSVLWSYRLSDGLLTQLLWEGKPVLLNRDPTPVITQFNTLRLNDDGLLAINMRISGKDSGIYTYQLPFSLDITALFEAGDNVPVASEPAERVTNPFSLDAQGRVLFAVDLPSLLFAERALLVAQASQPTIHLLNTMEPAAGAAGYFYAIIEQFDLTAGGAIMLLGLDFDMDIQPAATAAYLWDNSSLSLLALNGEPRAAPVAGPYQEIEAVAINSQGRWSFAEGEAIDDIPPETHTGVWWNSATPATQQIVDYHSPTATPGLNRLLSRNNNDRLAWATGYEGDGIFWDTLWSTHPTESWQPLMSIGCRFDVDGVAGGTAENPTGLALPSSFFTLFDANREGGVAWYNNNDRVAWIASFEFSSGIGTTMYVAPPRPYLDLNFDGLRNLADVYWLLLDFGNIGGFLCGDVETRHDWRPGGLLEGAFGFDNTNGDVDSTDLAVILSQLSS